MFSALRPASISARELADVLSDAGLDDELIRRAIADLARSTAWHARRVPVDQHALSVARERQLRRAAIRFRSALPPVSRSPQYLQPAVQMVSDALDCLQASLSETPPPPGRPRKMGQLQLAWNIAVTLASSGVPVTNGRAGVFAKTLILARGDAGDPIEDVFHVTRRIAPLFHQPSSLVAETVAARPVKHRSPAPEWARPAVLPAVPCLVPDWAEWIHDSVNRLNDPPVSVVVRVS